jgi:type VI secretion system protein ImpG
MSPRGWDDLLPYYTRELADLRQLGAVFARQYPKIAARLELGAYECADPHVERLLEAFAFLTARLHHQLDSEFPEITSALLGILFPQLVNPIPAMAIARFDVDPAQGRMTAGHRIARHTPLFAQALQGLRCRFQTCYPVTLWPVQVSYAGLEPTARFAFLDATTDVATVLRLRLASQSGSLQDLELRQLRFYLYGDHALVHTLYELLQCHVRRVAILPEGRSTPVYLPEEALTPVGFAPEEAVLPYPLQAHPGYRLVQEYFTFPEQFLFIDLHHLEAHASTQAFDVLLLLDQRPHERLALDQHTFLLGCTPIINLFRQVSEPIRLHQRQVEYRLVPDMRRERTTELHSILRVSAVSDADDTTRTFAPFFAWNHDMEGHEQQAFWHAVRRPSGRPDLPGTEMFLTFVDLDFHPSQPPTHTVYAHTLCTNRDLAEQLPANAVLQIEEAAPLERIVCLSKPTPQRDPSMGGETLWRLISHLSLNYLSLSDGPDSLKALREILRLYSVMAEENGERHILGLREMRSRQVVRRLGQEAWRGFCRGQEVTLVLDERAYVGGSAFLFAAVLRHFLALYTSVNSFTQVVLQSQQREGEWKRWAPLSGTQRGL